MLRSQENALKEFNMKFKLSMGFAFLREALGMDMSKEMLEQFMLMKLAFDHNFHARSEELNKKFDEENCSVSLPLIYPQLSVDAQQQQQREMRMPPLQGPNYHRIAPLPGLKQAPPPMPMVVMSSGSTNPFNNQRGPHRPVYSAPIPQPASPQYYYYSAPPPQAQPGSGYLHPVPPLVKQQSYPGSLTSSHNQQI